MPHLPPLRTRLGTRTEPHFSAPRREPAPGPAQPEFQVSEPPRAATPPSAPAGLRSAVDDDDFPVLTHVVTDRPEPTLPAAGEPVRQATVDPQAEEDELVDRITARILASLRPELEDIVAVAVREALQRERG